MVRLANLLWMDDQFPGGNALQEVFGDRYLNLLNPVFSNVRNAFRRSGFQYVSLTSRIWRNYNVAPLFCLQAMIDERVVPYTDTTSTLREIASVNSEFAIAPLQLLNLVKHNYLLHESAHLVAHELVHRDGPLVSLLCPTNGQQFVIKALLCEAFANTVEMMAAALADSDTHRLLFLFNSYVGYSLISRPSLRQIANLFDNRCVFSFAFLIFLFQNATGSFPSDLVLNCYINLAFGRGALNEKDELLLKYLAQKTFQLDRAFVADTSMIFFGFHETEDEYSHLRQCRFLADEIHLLGLMSPLQKLADIALGTAPGKVETV